MLREVYQDSDSKKKTYQHYFFFAKSLIRFEKFLISITKSKIRLTKLLLRFEKS